MDDNVNVLGAPISLTEFNYLCDCVEERSLMSPLGMVDKPSVLEFFDTQSAD